MAKKLNWEFFNGDVDFLSYGGKWISDELPNNGGRIGVELINMDDACGRDNEGKPEHILSVVYLDNPNNLKSETLQSALECCGAEVLTANESPTKSVKNG